LLDIGSQPRHHAIEEHLTTRIPRNTRIDTPSNLSKPPAETVHHQGALQARINPSHQAATNKCLAQSNKSCGGQG
jgi:hypothetical protein